MLHIVLTIIKFVGILFLCLLCLFVLLGCALIFVPVHYEAKGSYLEKIEGKQCLMKKRDLETEQKNGKIDVYVQQTLMDYLGGGLMEV